MGVVTLVQYHRLRLHYNLHVHSWASRLSQLYTCLAELKQWVGHWLLAECFTISLFGPFKLVQRFSKILQRTSKSGSNALANQNAALDRAQTRFVRMLEHEFESRFEICVLIGQHVANFRFLIWVARSRKTAVLQSFFKLTVTWAPFWSLTGCVKILPHGTKIEYAFHHTLSACNRVWAWDYLPHL